MTNEHETPEREPRVDVTNLEDGSVMEHHVNDDTAEKAWEVKAKDVLCLHQTGVRVAGTLMGPLFVVRVQGHTSSDGEHNENATVWDLVVNGPEDAEALAASLIEGAAEYRRRMDNPSDLLSQLMGMFQGVLGDDFGSDDSEGPDPEYPNDMPPVGIFLPVAENKDN